MIQVCDESILDCGYGYPVIALLAYHEPPSVADPERPWMRIDEQVDGMHCGTLAANILVLPVSGTRAREILEVTDDTQEPWRNDLSWGNTEMEAPEDPTIRAYLAALQSVGLTWTPTPHMPRFRTPYGWCLAQAVYPMDPTPENWQSLGLSGTLEEALGEPVDPKKHVIVMLTENDD